MRTDTAELVHPGIAAKYGLVVNVHEPGELSVVGEGCTVSNLTIMRDVYVGHDPVVVTQPRNSRIQCRTEIERAKLAYGVAVADFQARWLTRIFLVLRYLAK